MLDGVFAPTLFTFWAKKHYCAIDFVKPQYIPPSCTTSTRQALYMGLFASLITILLFCFNSLWDFHFLVLHLNIAFQKNELQSMIAWFDTMCHYGWKLIGLWLIYCRRGDLRISRKRPTLGGAVAIGNWGRVRKQNSFRHGKPCHLPQGWRQGRFVKRPYGKIKYITYNK